MELYLPGALLLAAVLRRGVPAGGRLYAAAACCAVVFTAQGYIVMNGDHRSGQLKAAALIALLTLSVIGLRNDVSDSHSHFLQPKSLPSVL